MEYFEYFPVAGFTLVLVLQAMWGSPSWTFLVLLFTAIVNVIINQIMTEADSMLLTTYALIDLATMILILKAGDVQIKFQSSVLTAAVFLHTLCLYDVYFGTSLAYKMYVSGLVTLTAMQIVGGLYDGMAQLLRASDHVRGLPPNRY